MVPAPIFYPNIDYADPAVVTPMPLPFNVVQNTIICVVGVGFVGESLLKEFGNVFKSIGYDKSEKRIQDLTSAFKSFGKVKLTSDETALAAATHYLISVPTLLRPDRSVNLDYVHAAVKTVLKYARPGCTIVIESSVCVGTTREILGPYKNILHCGMSPERVDPGRTFPTADKIPKLISGLTPMSLKAISQIYSKVFETVVPVSKPEVAEMTKLYENCYRMVNIAYVNEMSDACRSHGIDPFEMINAATTKPYGFQAFYPGLGVGGHCLHENAEYLFANNKNLPVLERATKLMWARPKKLARKFHRRSISDPTNDRNGVLPRILVVGVGFKPGQSVLSNSPGLSFAQRLNDTGCARLAFYDPLVSQDKVRWMEKLDDACWNPSYIDAEFDSIAICTKHPGVDFGVVERLQRAFVRCFV